MTKVYPEYHKFNGKKFEHARVLAEPDFDRPAVCVVTKVKDGVVYWRLWNSVNTRDCFPIEEATKWIRRWVE
jgi:hypothetical protein